jgi:hypothetical protein
MVTGFARSSGGWGPSPISTIPYTPGPTSPGMITLGELPAQVSEKPAAQAEIAIVAMIFTMTAPPRTGRNYRFDRPPFQAVPFFTCGVV